MITWAFLFSISILYAHRVECDFGEKVNSNETATASSESGDSPSAKAMMIIADDGVDIEKAALRAVITQEDDYEPPSPRIVTTTETPRSSRPTSFSGGRSLTNKLQEPSQKPKSPSSDQSGDTQIELIHPKSEPYTSTYFESNRIEQINNNPEPELPHKDDFQKGFSQNNDFNGFYETWNQQKPLSIYSAPFTTDITIAPMKGGPRHNNYDRLEQARLYQIEAAKSYINQIQAEQNYALKAQGLQETLTNNFYHSHPENTQQIVPGSGFSYLPPFSQQFKPSVPTITQAARRGNYDSLPNIGSPAPSSPINNFYNNPIVRHQINSPSHCWDGSCSFGGYTNQWRHDPRQFDNPLLKLNQVGGYTNPWNSLRTQWHDSANHLNGIQVSSPYPGPTASPVVLSSGFLDETEEVKRAKNIHLRAISATGLPSLWRAGSSDKTLS